MESVPRTEPLATPKRWRICTIRNLPEIGEIFMRTVASRYGLTIERPKPGVICVVRVDDTATFEELLIRAKNYWPQLEIIFDKSLMQKIRFLCRAIWFKVWNALEPSANTNTLEDTVRIETALLFENIEDQEAGERECFDRTLTLPNTACEYTLPANTVVYSQYTGLFVRLKIPLTVRIEERSDGNRENNRVAVFNMVAGRYYLLVKGKFRNDFGI